MVQLSVVNLVASLNIGIKIDLNKLVEKSPSVIIEYEPRQFPAAIVKLKEPKTSFSVFPNGRIICTGTNKLETARKAINKLIKNLKECLEDKRWYKN